MSETFNDFYRRNKDAVKLATNPDVVRDLYFQTDSDRRGFDMLPEFFDAWGVDWSVSFAKSFEASSGLRARLSPLELANYRMIFDRHMVNLSQAQFDQKYIDSSDERALFLLYKSIPPVRVCSAMSRVRGMTFDYVHGLANGRLGTREFETLHALSTLFYIELNHILRVYIYFTNSRGEGQTQFEVIRESDDDIPAGYEPPTTNSQMAYPKNKDAGAIELF